MKYVKAQEILKVKTGKYDANHAKVDGKYKFFTCAMEASYAETYAFDDEVLILPGNGANVGEVMYHTGKLEAYQRTYVLHEITEHVRYLLYYFKKDWVKQITKKQVGSATNYIKMDDILSFEIPLPALSTQKAIAERLDKADALRKKDKELLAQYDELAQAIFIDMFGDPVRNEKGWDLINFEEVLKLKRGYDLPVQDRKTTGKTPVFGSNGILGYHDEYKTNKPCIITGRSGTIGKVHMSTACCWPLNTTLYSYETYLNNIVYLSYLLLNLKIERFAHGAGVPTLDRKIVHKEMIPHISLELQNQFAEKIKNIEAQKAIVKQQAQQSEDLFQTLLQESFNFN